MHRFRIHRRPYHSIGGKQLVVLVVSVLLSLLLFSLYFLLSYRRDAVTLFVQQTESAVDVSVQNIDYYIENCIASARSVYVDNETVTLLSQRTDAPLTVSEISQLYNYLETVSYSTSAADQIFLASFLRDTSFLYVSSNLQTSSSQLSLTHDELPSFTSWRNIYVQPTHEKTTYGHVIRFDAPQHQTETELVFTIWFPIFNLPQGDQVTALVAIDFPTDFLNQNCQMVYEADEKMYIADRDGVILAASDPGAIFRTLDDMGAAIAQEDGDYSIQDDQLILCRQMDSAYLDWQIVRTAPLSKIYRTNLIQTFVLLGVFLCGLVVLVGINASQMLRYTVPLRRMTEYIHSIVQNRRWKDVAPLSNYVVYRGNDELGLLMDAFESMLSTIQNYILQQYELELAYTRSTLKMLQAQINPHFLYNTLQCFATNALKNQDLEQYRQISSFGQMLHYAMILEPAVVTVQEETDYVQRYLSLQQMRFKQKADVRIFIEPGAERCQLPRMTLQPLVENSILHGNVLKKPGSILGVDVRRDAGMLRVTVEDNGQPMDEEQVRQLRARRQQLRRIFDRHAARQDAGSAPTPLAQIFSRDESGNASIGVENVYLRLLLNFGGNCGVDFRANSIGGTTVELELPLKTAVQPGEEGWT